MTRDTRRRPQLLTTLLSSLVLAASLGVIIYLAVTSLPYLAVSPTTDPTFGVLNTCLLTEVPSSRLGFAVSRDVTQAAAWSSDRLALCGSSNAQRWPLAGVVDAAFDGDGRLWVTRFQPDGGEPALLLLENGQLAHRGDVRANQLVGVAHGVVALEASGRLVSVTSSGEVGGLVDLPALRDAKLAVSADGARVSVTAQGSVLISDAATLKRVRTDAPCDVEWLWWLRDGHRALISCGPSASWALILDPDTGGQETASTSAPVRSTLAGPLGPWVQPCDMLPCTAPEVTPQR